jgi:hypothetical protein
MVRNCRDRTEELAMIWDLFDGMDEVVPLAWICVCVIAAFFLSGPT